MTSRSTPVAKLGMIWAEAHDGAIGRDGVMPWHLPEDLAHFRASTTGDPVIMGRRTWESLPERFRPLPGRENIVVTRSASFEAPGAQVVGSLEGALATLGSQGGGSTALSGSGVDTTPVPAVPAAWIIGGGQLYREAMPFATELLVTRIDVDIEGADTFAPEIGPEWRLASPGEPLVSANGLGYRFERWVRG